MCFMMLCTRRVAEVSYLPIEFHYRLHTFGRFHETNRLAKSFYEYNFSTSIMLTVLFTIFACAFILNALTNDDLSFESFNILLLFFILLEAILHLIVINHHTFRK